MTGAGGGTVAMGDLRRLLDEVGLAAAGVVHVGAHRGQEVPVYRAAGFGLIRLVEPEPGLARRLRDRFPDCDVREVACAARGGRRRFNVANYRTWSSLYDIPSDQSIVPGRRVEVRDVITVDVVRLATIQDGCNVAVIDAQGAELDVLKGADLAALDLVIVETVEPSEVWRPALPRDVADEWFAERGWSAAFEWRHTAPDVRDVAYVPMLTGGVVDGDRALVVGDGRRAA